MTTYRTCLQKPRVHFSKDLIFPTKEVIETNIVRYLQSPANPFPNMDIQYNVTQAVAKFFSIFSIHSGHSIAHDAMERAIKSLISNVNEEEGYNLNENVRVKIEKIMLEVIQSCSKEKEKAPRASSVSNVSKPSKDLLSFKDFEDLLTQLTIRDSLKQLSGIQAKTAEQKMHLDSSKPKKKKKQKNLQSSQNSWKKGFNKNTADNQEQNLDVALDLLQRKMYMAASVHAKKALSALIELQFTHFNQLTSESFESKIRLFQKESLIINQHLQNPDIKAIIYYCDAVVKFLDKDYSEALKATDKGLMVGKVKTTKNHLKQLHAVIQTHLTSYHSDSNP